MTSETGQEQDPATLLRDAAELQDRAARTLAAARGALNGGGGHHERHLGEAVAAITQATSTRGILAALARAGARLEPAAGGVVLLRSETGGAPQLSAFWQGVSSWVEGSGRPPGMPEALERISRGDSAPDYQAPLEGAGLTFGECRLWLGQRAPGETGAEELLGVLVRTAGVALAAVHMQARAHGSGTRETVTGLFSRHYLEETLIREVHRCQRQDTPLGIIQLDIDNLSAFNQRHGRTTGDRVLRTVAGLLQSAFRGSDIACRLADDSFAVILPDADLHATRARAEELRGLIAELQPTFLGPDGMITASVGVAAFPELAVKTDEILPAADSAVELARSAGGNTVATAQRLG